MHSAPLRTAASAAHPLNRQLGGAVAALCFSIGAGAAPLTSANDAAVESQEATRTRTAAQALDEQRITESQAQSKTIKMLLEMQQAPAPLEGTGQSQREQAAQARAAKAAAQPEAPITGQDAPVVDWRSGLPGRSVASNQVAENSSSQTLRNESLVRTAHKPATQDTSSALRDLMPSQWIQFLRENRQWVLTAGLGLLAVGWGVASMFARRR